MRRWVLVLLPVAYALILASYLPANGALAAFASTLIWGAFIVFQLAPRRVFEVLPIFGIAAGLFWGLIVANKVGIVGGVVYVPAVSCGVSCFIAYLGRWYKRLVIGVLLSFICSAIVSQLCPTGPLGS